MEAEYRNPNYDFSTLFENVVWGNTQMFFPISLVMIGSWLIDRESTHDTLKNIMTIPVSMPKMLGAKLFWVGIFAVLLGIYSVGVTLITGLTVGLSGLTVEVFFHGGNLFGSKPFIALRKIPYLHTIADLRCSLQRRQLA